MDDDEWVFARRLGYASGRHNDWWKIKDEYTPYEWQLEQLAEQIDPLGPQRMERFLVRIAVRIIAALNGGMTEIEAREEYENLIAFLPKDRTEERTLTPEEAEAIERAGK